jgi:hypothetical protein
MLITVGITLGGDDDNDNDDVAVCEDVDENDNENNDDDVVVVNALFLLLYPSLKLLRVPLTYQKQYLLLSGNT